MKKNKRFPQRGGLNKTISQGANKNGLQSFNEEAATSEGMTAVDLKPGEKKKTVPESIVKKEE